MVRYVTKRLLISILIVWGVLTLTFAVVHLAPGDPASIYVSPEISEKTVVNIRAQMGLDKPIFQQYLFWMKELIQGNFGFSFSHKIPVLELFKQSIPNTLQLTLVVFIVQFILGILIGIVAAIRQNTKIDHIIHSILIFIYSIPGFWLALTMVLIFSYKLGWLPSSQMSTIGLSGDYWTILWDRISHLILPATVLILPFSAYTARFVRGSFCEVMDQAYIRTVFAYGLKKSRIYLKYALKNSLLPMATLFGLYLPFLLGGAVITEYIFAWPGMGRLTVEAIFAHDFPVILASTLIASFAVVIGNLISDVLYVFIDPRIKLNQS